MTDGDDMTLRTSDDWAGSDGSDATMVGSVADTDEPEVEALVVDIATTRSEMSQTVDELGDRLSPSTMTDRAGQAVRDATVGKLEAKVNDMSTTASELVSNAGQTAQETGSGIVETIRRNPIPAVMAGVGIGWLWMNRTNGQTSSTQWMNSGRRPMRSGWEAGNDGWRRSETVGMGNGSSSIGDRMGDASTAVGDAADEARRRAGDAVDTIGMSASRAADTIGMNASGVATQAQQAIESNPLAFGAVAIAVGTAIGLALPATQAEKRMMGSTGSRLIDQVETAVSEPLDRMQQQAQQSQQQV
jgi:ElaB/YqjD/DUF883 family membrane-anchored ribosome-binding protein